jgi:hypothetical protein
LSFHLVFERPLHQISNPSASFSLQSEENWSIHTLKSKTKASYYQTPLINNLSSISFPKQHVRFSWPLPLLVSLHYWCALGFCYAPVPLEVSIGYVAKKTPQPELVNFFFNWCYPTLPRILSFRSRPQLLWPQTQQNIHIPIEHIAI